MWWIEERGCEPPHRLGKETRVGQKLGEDACVWQRGVEGRERKYEDRVLNDDEDRQCHR